MIWKRPSDSAEASAREPIVVISDSALIKFASKFKMTDPRPGRVIGGALEGAVRITGDDNLSITGRNFNFSEAALLIWSDEPLAFTQAGNKGTGTGLELNLVPGPPTADKPGIDGIRIVRLRKDVVMDLASPDKPGQPPGEKVQITSAGAFEYSVESHVAVFHDNVQVTRPTGPDQADTLRRCDVLTMVFEPVAPGAPTQAAPAPAAPGAGKMGDNVAFRRMRAEGKNMSLISQRSDLNAEMAELTYDSQTKIIVLRDPREARLVQRNNEIFCPELTVEHDAAGKIGKADCRGAGHLNSFSPDPANPALRGPLAFSAAWLRQLRKYPDQQPGLDVIEFTGQAVLRQTGEMVLEGETIKIWIAPDAPKTASPPTAKTPAAPAGGLTGNAAALKPKRLQAVQKVAFSTPQLHGHTEQLEVWFEPGALPQPLPARAPPAAAPPEPTPAPASTQRRQASAPLARRTEPQHVPIARQAGPARTPAARQPAGLAAVGDRDSHRAGAATPARPHAPQPPAAKKKSTLPTMPIGVDAGLIRVRVIQDGEQSEVAEIWTEGAVHVTQDRADGKPPLDLRGDRLHLRNYSEVYQVVKVEGAPARVQDGGMAISGPEINLDRGQNTTDVQGAGQLTLPVNNSLDGKLLETPQALDVWWKEQMRFNGLIATFYGDVRAEHGDIDMKCQELEVTLSQRMSFSEQGPADQKPDVKQIVCKDLVDVVSYQYEFKKLVGVRKAQAREFTYVKATGAANAEGPGALLVWRRIEGGRSGLSPDLTMRANRPLEAENGAWDYTRIDFAGIMRGNMNSKSTRFDDRVRVVHGPVATSSDIVDPDDLPVNGGWLRCDSMHITHHEETRTHAAYKEMLGTGNAELDGHTSHGVFHALADSISFDESKGLYVLRSLPGRKASINRQIRIGGPSSHVDSLRIEFNPALNQLKTNRTSVVDGLE